MSDTNRFQATVKEGVRVYKEYQLGRKEYLSNWKNKCLTPKGCQVIDSLGLTATEDQIYSKVTEAVGAGY